MRKKKILFFLFFCLVICLFHFTSFAATKSSAKNIEVPISLESYNDPDGSVWDIIKYRAKKDPLNLAALIIFGCAIIHTFFAPYFHSLSYKLIKPAPTAMSWDEWDNYMDDPRDKTLITFGAEILYFLGEVEVVFGIWVLPLMIVIASFYDWPTAVNYINDQNFAEPLFIIVIIAIASSRPIVIFAEQTLRKIAKIGGNSPAAWWFTILTIAPLLGSFITEPAAMTLAAILLIKKFYHLRPSNKFKYATLGLLFTNISVGGVLTDFAAPAVLMVAKRWGWDTPYMMKTFGWKAIAGIVVANIIYFVIFRKEFKYFSFKEKEDLNEKKDFPHKLPIWITVVHLLFFLWTVINSHETPLVIGGFILFLGFYQATSVHQFSLNLKTPLLVGFFFAGLIIHGGLQAWWIEPMLANIGRSILIPLTIVLSAFNDNAAITYLISLIPNFPENLKYDVIASAISAGGITIIANAPNPAGYALLKGYYKDNISPIYLFLSALLPMCIMLLFFTLFGLK